MHRRFPSLTSAHGDRGAKFEATREPGPHEGDRRGVRVWRLELAPIQLRTHGVPGSSTSSPLIATAPRFHSPLAMAAQSQVPYLRHAPSSFLPPDLAISRSWNLTRRFAPLLLLLRIGRPWGT